MTGRAAGWQFARRVLAYAGVVAGVVALSVGAVYAVSVVGLAAKPGGFAAPLAYGPSVAVPPVVASPEQGAQEGEAPSTDGESGPVAGSTMSDSEALPESVPGSEPESAPVLRIDPEWLSRIAGATGIPERALSAYAFAHVTIAEAQPGCGVDWATIAAIGSIESDHGSHGSSVLDANGYSSPAIIGRALDGDGVATIRDTDGGLFDGDAVWDRAVGPMQFIPSTWERWASDANGDDVADPNQIDDAAMTTARYLCASGPMTSQEAWRAAIYSYNHDSDYVDKVARVANEYTAAAG